MPTEPAAAHGAHTHGTAVELLLEAGVVLAESLDLATTLQRVADSRCRAWPTCA